MDGIVLLFLIRGFLTYTEAELVQVISGDAFQQTNQFVEERLQFSPTASLSPATASVTLGFGHLPSQGMLPLPKPAVSVP